MIQRYTSAVFVAIGITTSLVWLMHALIVVSHGTELDETKRSTLVFTSVIEDTEITTVDKRPIPPRPPVNPPPLVPPTNTGEPTTPIGFHGPAPTPPTPGGERFQLGYANSALINIINAQPDYPLSASEKGLEGNVVVQFDVSESGAVENAVVVETTSSVFNKAAIKAAYRSRYRARSVDGVPQRSFGLRKLFRFEMENQQ